MATSEQLMAACDSALSAFARVRPQNLALFHHAINTTNVVRAELVAGGLAARDRARLETVLRSILARGHAQMQAWGLDHRDELRAALADLTGT